MKLIITLFAVIAVVSAVKQEKFMVTPDILKSFKQLAEPCAAQFEVDPSIIKKLGDDSLPRDQATNNFLYCFGFNGGFIDKDGHFNADAIANLVDDHRHAEEFKEAIQKCAEITKDDPVATVVAEHQCYCETSPILFDYGFE